MRANNNTVIRAIYSWRNQTMLTCTVSMVENAVAIIAACLPGAFTRTSVIRSLLLTVGPHTALRTMLLGHTSQAGTSSYGNHYELSSKQRRSRPSRVVTDITGTGTRVTPNDSDEELVTDTKSFGSGPSSFVEAKGGTGAIMVNTRVEVYHRDEAESSKIVQSPFDSRAY